MYTFAKPKRPVTRVFLHCSASDNPAHDNVATMRRWHVDGNGWSDVGYHLFVRKSGLVEAGRSLELIPAAQAGHNTGTVAICCHGLEAEKFTEAQFVTLRDLARQIDAAYGGAVTFHGHREVANKLCPVYDYRAVLGLDAKGRLGRLSRPSTDADDPVDFTRMLRRGSTGEDVRWLQARLTTVAKFPVPGTSVFDAATETAVIAFQRASHLVPDGIYGPLTNEAMDEASAALPKAA